MKFLPNDQVKAQRELDCYGYFMKLAIEQFMSGNFEKSAKHHENMARSLRELERLKENKRTFDKFIDLIKKAQHNQQCEELIRRNFVI